MTDYIVNGADLTSIANKIRAKGQTSAPIVFPGGFTDAIDNLPDEPVLEPLSVTDNGDYTPGAGVDGFSRVSVNVPSKTSLAGATLTPGANKTYTGQEQTQTGTVVSNTVTLVEGQDYTLSGDKGTNAGDYSLVATGINNFSGSKSAPWSIAKAQGSIGVSPNTLAIDGAGSTDTATITKVGDGAVSASSSDASVATASVSGDTVTVTAVGAGTATITVTMADGTNYLGASAAIAVEVTSSVNVYGASWDGTASTAWTRTDAAENFADPVPYVSGATQYGSPFDSCMPWSGMQIVENAEAGSVVSIPKFWYKITQNGSGMTIQIADGAVDGFSVSPAHMDRGDGKGERDVVYVGRYHCSDAAYKSASGQVPKTNVTRSDFRTNIHSLGSTVYQADWAMRFTLFLLYLVEFANWNSQDKIGYGCGNNSSKQNMGYTDSMPYHTGTTQSRRTAYGLGTQYRYIEGLWDNVYDWVDGCYNSSSGLNLILNPANFSDSSGGVSVGTPISGYPSAFSVKEVSGTFPLFIPSEDRGSNSTYSCDYWHFGSSGPCVCAGGGYVQVLDHGLFYWYYTSAARSGGNRGSRSMILP